MREHVHIYVSLDITTKCNVSHIAKGPTDGNNVENKIERKGFSKTIEEQVIIS